MKLYSESSDRSEFLLGCFRNGPKTMEAGGAVQ
jgi:hypothetical protein